MARTEYYYDPDAPTANSIVVAVTVFVPNDADELLMIRRSDNDLWALPGGGCLDPRRRRDPQPGQLGEAFKREPSGTEWYRLQP